MSLNLCLTDPTDRTEFRLRQTPTSATVHCMRLDKRTVVEHYKYWLRNQYPRDREYMDDVEEHLKAMDEWLAAHPCAKFGCR